MDKPLHIVVLAGTTRAHRQSIHAARLIARLGQEIDGIAVEFVDPMDFEFPGDGKDPEGQDPRYSAITARADGFFIVTPEYNHSYPGSLKRMLDSELANYRHKPVALAGVSSGNWGGVRAVEALLHPVRSLGLVVSNTDVFFPRVQDLFNDQGELVGEYNTEGITKAYSELIWLARTLKNGRDTTS